MTLEVAMEAAFPDLMAIPDNTTQYIFGYVMIYVHGTEQNS